MGLFQLALSNSPIDSSNQGYRKTRIRILLNLQALHKHWVKTQIKLPTPQEAKVEACLFRDRSGFPVDIWAAIDGSFIKVHNFAATQACLT